MALVGMSFDRPEDNAAFAASHGYQGPLLSDPDHVAGEAYETRRSPEEDFPEFAKRRTYVIDPEGQIVRSYRVTDIAGHPQQLLDDLEALGAISS